MQQTANGSVTIRRLTNGDTLQAYLQADSTLIQVVDENGNNPAPDWSTTNQPTIVPRVYSVRGQSVQLTSVQWLLDGSEVARLTIGQQPVVTDGFELDAGGNLKIKTNIIKPGAVFTHTLALKANVVVGGTIASEVNAHTEIVPVQASASAYTLLLSPKEFTLDDTVGSVTITPNLLKSTAPVTIDGVNARVKWYKVLGGSNNDEPIDATSKKTQYYTSGNNLIVLRDGVDGAATFVCKAEVKDSGSWAEVDGEACVVHDMTDAYNVVITGKDYVDPAGTTTEEKTCTLQAVLINTNQPDAAVQVPVGGWKVDVKSNITLLDIDSSKYTFSQSAGRASFSMNVDNMTEMIGGVKTDICPVIIFEATI